MDYTLAKQLKDAGFPQGHYQRVFDQVREYPEQANMYAEAYMVKSLDEIVYYPTLSELISALNDKDIRVLTFVDKKEYKRVGYSEGNNQTIIDGESYEECLAKIWLTPQ